MATATAPQSTTICRPLIQISVPIEFYKHESQYSDGMEGLYDLVEEVLKDAADRLQRVYPQCQAGIEYLGSDDMERLNRT